MSSVPSPSSSPGPPPAGPFLQEQVSMAGMDTKAVRRLYCPDLRAAISDSHALEVRHV